MASAVRRIRTTIRGQTTDMSRFTLALALGLAAVTAGCQLTPKPPTSLTVLTSIEEQKKDVARLRDRGQITYEEAVRRQFAIERNNYELSQGQMSFWRAMVLHGVDVDRGRITPAQFRALQQQEYLRWVEPQVREAEARRRAA